MSIVYPFPTLHADSLDYDDSNAYDPEIKKIDNVIHITHKLSTGNLVASLIEQQSAYFFATVCISGTIFRKTKLLKLRGVTRRSLIVGEQRFEIPSFMNTDMNTFTVFVRPGVVLKKACDICKVEAIGVSKFHKYNATIHFPDHAIIAFTDWHYFFSMGTLFAMRSDKELDKEKEGVFRVEISYEPALKITLVLSSKLYDEMERNPSGTTRSHIICSALTFAFKEFYEHYHSQDDYDAELEKAESLKNFLQSEALTTWEDEDFDATYVSSKLKPVFLQSSGDNDSR